MTITLVLSFFGQAAPGDYRTTSLTLMREQLVGDGFEVTIPVDDDRVLEAREDFLGRLQLTQQSLDLGVVRLGQDEGEISIIDNDGETLMK